jgi:hypothetical protein
MNAKFYWEKMNEDIFSCLSKIEEVSPIDDELEGNINDDDLFCNALQESKRRRFGRRFRRSHLLP